MWNRIYHKDKKIECDVEKNNPNRSIDYVNIFFYIASLAVVLLVKISFDKADNASLVFILAPITKIVSIFHGSEFIFENGLGFFSTQLGITINKSCAGINFMLVVYSMLSFSYIHRCESLRRKVIYFIAIFPISYLMSLLTNSFRIIVSITMQRLSFLDDWTSPEVIHNLTGMFIFICFLFLLNYVFSTILKKERCTYEEDS